MCMVWPQNTKISEGTYIGLHNNYFKQETFLFNEIVEKDGVGFIFHKSKESLDSFDCNCQTLNLPNLMCKKIHFAGTCGWGYYKEKVELLFADGTSDYAKIGFSNICYPLKDVVHKKIGLEKEEFINASRVLFQDTINNRSIYIYHNTVCFEQTRVLTEIRFPDNIFMVIMAVTIED